MNFGSSSFSATPEPDATSDGALAKKTAHQVVSKESPPPRRTARSVRAGRGRRSVVDEERAGDAVADMKGVAPEEITKPAHEQPPTGPDISSLVAGNSSFIIEDKPDELEPMAPPPAVPDFPRTGCCDWSFDAISRVLLADFRRPTRKTNCPIKVCREDEEFLLGMMERDDLSVVSEGLADRLNPVIWDLNYISGCVGDEYYHKIRRFQRKVVPKSDVIIEAQEHPAEVSERATETNQVSMETNDNDSKDEVKCYVVHQEMDVNLSVKVSDYIRYLDRRRKALATISHRRMNAGLDPVNPNGVDDEVGHESPKITNSDVEGTAMESDVSEEEMEIIGHDGTVRQINVVNDVLYLIDYDMVKLLPALSENFLNTFLLPGCTPGGSHCMMNAVNSNGRPFMGPNLYISPPASFTHFHQDGHGTVDSGHQCLSGYNEVVMLRRMPEHHKRDALHLLNGEDRRKGVPPSDYDALYGLPHGDNLGAKPMWPDSEAIQKCKEMNYCPSVFILKPGQHVHINKGRLHAFRKMAPSTLPPSDCHSNLRAAIIKDNDLGGVEQICMSIAWDWMFKGVTSSGIHQELDSVLKCAQLNRVNGRQSLAIPETSLLQMARVFTSAYERAPQQSSMPNPAPMFNFSASNSDRTEGGRFQPAVRDVLKGIHHSLKYIVTRHTKALAAANELKQLQTNLERVSLSMRPNTWENPELFALDPYGNGDFFCRLCGYELSNIYMHCDGCEEILNKDFNICVNCHAEGRHKRFEQMHPLNKKRHSTINHTGDFEKCRQSRCPCKNGPACKACSYCAGCSCKCHRCFTLHVRFMMVDDESKLLKRVEDAIGPDKLSPEDCILKRFLLFEEKRRVLQEQAIKETDDSLEGTQSDAEQPVSNSLPTVTVAVTENDGGKSGEVEASNAGKIKKAHVPSAEYVVGRTVVVEARTGPGRHKPGGVGRIVKVHHAAGDDSRVASVDVKYVMGGRDKLVPAGIVRIAAEYERSTKQREEGNSDQAQSSPRQRRPHDSIVSTQDWSRRSSALIDADASIATEMPKSKLDLSAAALSFTAPGGEMDIVERGSKLEGGVTNQVLEEFLKAARQLQSPTMNKLHSFLPKHCWLDENQIRHLYRNFCDEKEISGDDKYARVNASRREVDIINYFIAEDKDFRDCYLLMPYRNVVSVSKLYKFLKKKRFTKVVPGYQEHIVEKVGNIFRLESTDESPSEIKNGKCSVEEGKDGNAETIPTSEPTHRTDVDSFIVTDECSDGGVDKTVKSGGCSNEVNGTAPSSGSNTLREEGRIDTVVDGMAPGTKVSDLCAAETAKKMLEGASAKQCAPAKEDLFKRTKQFSKGIARARPSSAKSSTQMKNELIGVASGGGSMIETVSVADHPANDAPSLNAGKCKPESNGKGGENQKTGVLQNRSSALDRLRQGANHGTGADGPDSSYGGLNVKM